MGRTIYRWWYRWRFILNRCKTFSRSKTKVYSVGIRLLVVIDLEKCINSSTAGLDLTTVSTEIDYIRQFRLYCYLDIILLSIHASQMDVWSQHEKKNSRVVNTQQITFSTSRLPSLHISPLLYILCIRNI